MIHFDEYGSRNNPTVLLLHGEGVVDTFCGQYGLKEEYHLVVPHLFGAGKEADEEYNPAKQLLALRELIEAIGKEKISLIGFSLGAGLAVLLTDECPQYFDRVAFFSPDICSNRFSIGVRTVLAEIWGFFMRKKFFLRKQAESMNFTRAQTEFYMEYGAAVKGRQYGAWVWNAISLDECIHYKKAELPMLAVCGELEGGGVKVSVAELADRNPNCRMKLIKNSGHNFLYNNRDMLNTILTEFLKADIEVVRFATEEHAV